MLFALCFSRFRNQSPGRRPIWSAISPKQIMHSLATHLVGFPMVGCNLSTFIPFQDLYGGFWPFLSDSNRVAFLKHVFVQTLEQTLQFELFIASFGVFAVQTETNVKLKTRLCRD